MNPVENLEIAIDEYQVLSTVLHDDIELIRKQYAAAPTQPVARTLIRAIFASIEGQTYRLKQWALGSYIRYGRKPQPGELALLEEIAFDLSEKGKIIRRNARTGTAANIRFSFEAMARAHGLNYEFNAEELGWIAFQHAMTIRHRLTHPKSAKDLNVEHKEVAIAVAAVQWFHHSSMSLLIQAVKAMATNNPEIISNVERIESEWVISSEKVRSFLMSKRKKHSKTHTSSSRKTVKRSAL